MASQVSRLVMCGSFVPIANPGKIVGAPVNYKRHLQEARDDPAVHHANQIAEIEQVGLFLKATSSVIGPSEAIMTRHRPDRRTDHEIELAVVIGKKADRSRAAPGIRLRSGLLHWARHHRSRPRRAQSAKIG